MVFLFNSFLEILQFYSFKNVKDQLHETIILLNGELQLIEKLLTNLD